MKVLLDGTAFFVGALTMNMKTRKLTREEITEIEQTVAKGVERVLAKEFDKQLKITGVVVGNVREVRG